MNYFNICSKILSSLSLMSFRFRPKNDDLIQQGSELVKAFENLSDSERKQIISLISADFSIKLLTLSGFMAEAAINNNDKSLIKSAIIMHVLEDFQRDYRENIRYLVLILFAANKLGMDFNCIINTVLPLASDRAKNSFSDFSTRGDGLNKLSSFGIQENIIDGVFRFAPM